MVGISAPGLDCSGGYTETELYERSKIDLRERFGLSDLDIDDRLVALSWAVERGNADLVKRVPNRNLWAAVTPGGFPPLRFYLCPSDSPGVCELRWVEERPLDDA
jgi:hypothetical protein